MLARFNAPTSVAYGISRAVAAASKICVVGRVISVFLLSGRVDVFDSAHQKTESQRIAFVGGVHFDRGDHAVQFHACGLPACGKWKTSASGPGRARRSVG